MNECCPLEELQVIGVNACPLSYPYVVALVSVPLMPLPEVLGSR